MYIEGTKGLALDPTLHEGEEEEDIAADPAVLATGSEVAVTVVLVVVVVVTIVVEVAESNLKMDVIIPSQVDVLECLG